MIYQNNNSIGTNFFECLRYENFKFDSHMHRHPEVIYVRSGLVEITVGNVTQAINCGEYALVLANQPHSYKTPLNSVVDVCIFSEDFAPSFFKKLRGKKVEGIRFICRESIKKFAEDEMFVLDHIPDFFLIKACIYAILNEYSKFITTTNAVTKNEHLIAQITEYVYNNHTKKITLKSMAADLGYEYHYLSRCFHENISMNFSKYVNWHRINTANELLQNSELSITEIAMQSGFGSLRTFNRVYFEYTNKTPRTNRRTSVIREII